MYGIPQTSHGLINQPFDLCQDRNCPHTGLRVGTEDDSTLERFPNLLKRSGNGNFGLANEEWLGRQDSNLGMPVPKTGALPLGDAPSRKIACQCISNSSESAWML